MAMKENSKAILNYLKETKCVDPNVNGGEGLTADDVAAALGLTTKQVNGSFTSAIQRKELGFREEGEIELADGKHKAIKYLRLNEAGYAFDPDVHE